MALDDTYNIVRPGQSNQAGAINALHIEEYAGFVEGTIERKSVIAPHIPLRAVKGTSVISANAVGESTLQKLTAGTPLDGTLTDFSKRTLTIDTVVAARSVLPLLETFQTQYDSRKEIGTEHGKKIAKFRDQSFFIQAIKAALQTESSYRNGGAAGKPAGHFGGSQQVLSAAGDALDPAKLYSALASLFTKMAGKDVDAAQDDVLLAVRPEHYYVLLQAEQLINMTYVTSEGNKVDGTVLKAYGVPIVSSNNLPNTVIASHFLGTAFDGDYTKVVAVAFAPKSLLAGETIPLTHDVFFDKITKQWFVDSHMAYNVTTNRAEYSGAILLP